MWTFSGLSRLRHLRQMFQAGLLLVASRHSTACRQHEQGQGGPQTPTPNRTSGTWCLLAVEERADGGGRGGVQPSGNQVQRHVALRQALRLGTRAHLPASISYLKLGPCHFAIPEAMPSSLGGKHNRN